MNSYQDLIVWQKAVVLATETYRLTEVFPKSEAYGLTGQIRRAAVSVASNIAEGFSRGSQKEFANFLNIALGSASELETQLIIAVNVGYLGKDFRPPEQLLEVRKMIVRMLQTMRNK